MKVLELIKQLEKTLGTSESPDSIGYYTANYMINRQCHLSGQKTGISHPPI